MKRTMLGRKKYTIIHEDKNATKQRWKVFSSKGVDKYGVLNRVVKNNNLVNNASRFMIYESSDLDGLIENLLNGQKLEVSDVKTTEEINDEILTLKKEVEKQRRFEFANLLFEKNENEIKGILCKVMSHSYIALLVLNSNSFEKETRERIHNYVSVLNSMIVDSLYNAPSILAEEMVKGKNSEEAIDIITSYACLMEAFIQYIEICKENKVLEEFIIDDLKKRFEFSI